MIVAWPQSQFDERPRVGNFLDLPPVVALIASHGFFAGLVPGTGRLHRSGNVRESKPLESNGLARSRSSVVRAPASFANALRWRRCASCSPPSRNRMTKMSSCDACAAWPWPVSGSRNRWPCSAVAQTPGTQTHVSSSAQIAPYRARRMIAETPRHKSQTARRGREAAPDYVELQPRKGFSRTKTKSPTVAL